MIKYLNVNMMIPKQYNDNSNIPLDKYDLFNKYILNNFDGFTVIDNLKGYWLNDSKLYQDLGYLYIITIEDNNINKSVIRKIKDYARVLFEQIEIYCTLNEVTKL